MYSIEVRVWEFMGDGLLLRNPKCHDGGILGVTSNAIKTLIGLRQCEPDQLTIIPGLDHTVLRCKQKQNSNLLEKNKCNLTFS